MNSKDTPVAFITGASGNLGAAAARAFLAAGYRLALPDRADDRLSKAFPELANSADHALLGGVDLGDEESVKVAVDTTIKKLGRIDVLVNAVGAWRGGKPVHETPLADWEMLHAANVFPTLLSCRAVAPHMIAQGNGAIVNVAARGGLHGDAGNAAYSATKSAVLRITEAMSEELKTKGVNVNAVLPATIDTPQNRAAMPSADYSKWVAPEAIADVILFLSSPAARAVHGAAIPVYGTG